MFHCAYWKIVVRAIRVHFGPYLRTYGDYGLQICRISSSKVIVGSGDLNSKSVVSALCMVFSWRVTYGSICAISLLIEYNNSMIPDSDITLYMYIYIYRIFPLLSACAYIFTGRKPMLNSKVRLIARST